MSIVWPICSVACTTFPSCPVLRDSSLASNAFLQKLISDAASTQINIGINISLLTTPTSQQQKNAPRCFPESYASATLNTQTTLPPRQPLARSLGIPGFALRELPGEKRARSVFEKLAEAGAEIVEERPHRRQQAALGRVHRMNDVLLGGPAGQQAH